MSTIVKNTPIAATKNAVKKDITEGVEKTPKTKKIKEEKNIVRTYGTNPFFKKKEASSIKTILKDFDLAWTVEKKPIFFHDQENKKSITIPERFATIRTDINQTLGIVGKQYKISQNDQLVQIITPLLDRKDIHIETAGYFDMGRLVYVLLRINNHIEIKSDKIEPFIFIGTSHDGTRKINIGLTTVRVICQNTFNYNMKNANLKFMHSHNLADRLKDASLIMSMTDKLIVDLTAIFDKMQKNKVDDAFINKTLRHMLAISDKMKLEEASTRKINLYHSMFDSINKEFESHASLKGNIYGVFQGITAFYNHGRKFENGEHQLEQIIIGGSHIENQRAFNYLKALTS